MNNIAESVKTRLLNLARKEKKDYVLITRLYMQEGILRRIGISKYSDSFCLKGGLLLYSISGFTSRPTMDLDLLGINIPSGEDKFRSILTEILSIEAADGLVFVIESLKFQEIIEGADYHGQQIKVLCRLGSIRTNLKLDIGFGDTIYPGPVQMEYPTLLETDSIQISAYSLESVIAEKFDAMIVLDARNSRMKDFYDIYDILTNHKIDQTALGEAVRLTFKTRKTILPENPAIFQHWFSSDPRNLQLWKGLLNRIKVEEIGFAKVMNKVTGKLYPIYINLKK
jgi:predicted nucleotidyltransferase component of viral defense system